MKRILAVIAVFFGTLLFVLPAYSANNPPASLFLSLENDLPTQVKEIVCQELLKARNKEMFKWNLFVIRGLLSKDSKGDRGIPVTKEEARGHYAASLALEKVMLDYGCP